MASWSEADNPTGYNGWKARDLLDWSRGLETHKLPFRQWQSSEAAPRRISVVHVGMSGNPVNGQIVRGKA